jgi:hypothetical protein
MGVRDTERHDAQSAAIRLFQRPEQFMRISIFLISIVAAHSTTALGESDCRCWLPDAQQIASIEEEIATGPMPLGSLDRYARYYAGVTERIGDRRFIRGKFVPLGVSETPGIHVVEGKMPPLQGEGCISSSEPTQDRWIDFVCASPGAWTPTALQIGELEDAMRRQGAKGLDYVRHYAGVTQGDHRIILGEFVRPGKFGEADKEPGIHIESEVELPMISDGGCGVIRVRFDPSKKGLDWQCGGR